MYKKYVIFNNLKSNIIITHRNQSEKAHQEIPLNNIVFKYNTTKTSK